MGVGDDSLCGEDVAPCAVLAVISDEACPVLGSSLLLLDLGIVGAVVGLSFDHPIRLMHIQDDEVRVVLVPVIALDPDLSRLVVSEPPLYGGAIVEEVRQLELGALRIESGDDLH
jgi:hypothetical protein